MGTTWSVALPLLRANDPELMSVSDSELTLTTALEETTLRVTCTKVLSLLSVIVSVPSADPVTITVGTSPAEGGASAEGEAEAEIEEILSETLPIVLGAGIVVTCSK